MCSLQYTGAGAGAAAAAAAAAAATATATTTTTTTTTLSVKALFKECCSEELVRGFFFVGCWKKISHRAETLPGPVLN